MYLTFSESFETIEAIFQKLLTEPKFSFSKSTTFCLNGLKNNFDRLIGFEILVQLAQNTLKMLTSLLFYDVKFNNLDSLLLQAIFDPVFDTHL